MTTNAYAAKRAIFAALRDLAAVPGNLDDLAISYADPGRFGEGKMIYGGGIVFDQPGEGDLEDGDDVLIEELAIVGLHIRVQLPGLDVEALDEIAEGIGEQLGALLRRDRHLAGGLSITRIAGGQCDHFSTDTANVSTLTYRIGVRSNFTQ